MIEIPELLLTKGTTEAELKGREHRWQLLCKMAIEFRHRLVRMDADSVAIYAICGGKEPLVGHVIDKLTANHIMSVAKSMPGCVGVSIHGMWNNLEYSGEMSFAEADELFA